MPDVYQYESVPQALRVQIAHIVRDGLGNSPNYENRAVKAYKAIHDALCREYGLFSLSQSAYGSSPETDVLNYMLQSDDVERVLDVTGCAFG